MRLSTTRQVTRCWKEGAGLANKGKASWAVHLSPALRDKRALHTKTEGITNAHSGAAWSPATVQWLPTARTVPSILQSRNHLSKSHKPNVTLWLQSFSGPLRREDRAPTPPLGTKLGPFSPASIFTSPHHHTGHAGGSILFPLSELPSCPFDSPTSTCALRHSLGHLT